MSVRQIVALGKGLLLLLSVGINQRGCDLLFCAGQLCSQKIGGWALTQADLQTKPNRWSGEHIRYRLWFKNGYPSLFLDLKNFFRSLTQMGRVSSTFTNRPLTFLFILNLTSPNSPFMMCTRVPRKYLKALKVLGNNKVIQWCTSISQCATTGLMFVFFIKSFGPDGWITLKVDSSALWVSCCWVSIINRAPTHNLVSSPWQCVSHIN